MEMIKTEELKELIKKADKKEIKDLIEVKKYISLQEYAQMISNMVEMVFSGGIYNPYLYEFAFNYNFFKYYTNVDCTDIDVIFELCQITSIDYIIDWNTIFALVSEDYSKAVEFRKQLICSSSSWDSIGDLVAELITKLNTSVDKINNSEISIKDLVTAFKNMPNSDEIAKSVLEIEKQKLDDKDEKVKDFPINETKQ